MLLVLDQYRRGGGDSKGLRLPQLPLQSSDVHCYELPLGVYCWLCSR